MDVLGKVGADLFAWEKKKKEKKKYKQTPKHQVFVAKCAERFGIGHVCRGKKRDGSIFCKKTK